MKKKVILCTLIVLTILLGLKLTNNLSSAFQTIFKIKTVDNKGNTLANAEYEIYGKPTLEETGKTAMFDTGDSIYSKIFNLSIEPVEGYYECGDNGDEYCGDEDGSLVEKILKADSLPDDFEPSEENTISTGDSEYPIYIWYDYDTKELYYYTEANKIYLNQNASYMFCSLYQLNEIQGMENWDTSKVTDMSGLFGDTNISNIDALANWDTSKVTDMIGLFNNTSISNIDALANWDTSQVKNMNFMLSSRNLQNINGASNWDTSKVTDMIGLFNDTSISNIDALANWDTSQVIDMSHMFGNCKNLQDINGASNWDTSKVTNMFRMFLSCTNLQNINGASNWDTSIVTDITGMFSHCPKVKGTFTIKGNPTIQYSEGPFYRTATEPGSGIVVNYSKNTTNIDYLLSHISPNSNVVKGVQID